MYIHGFTVRTHTHTHAWDRVLFERRMLRSGQRSVHDGKATGWTTEKPWFDSRQGQDSFILQSFQIDFRTNRSSYSMGIDLLFLLEQSAMGMKLTTHFHIVWNLGTGGSVPPSVHVTCTGITPLIFARYRMLFFFSKWHGFNSCWNRKLRFSE